MDKWGKGGAVWLLDLTNGRARVLTHGYALAVSRNGLGCLAFSPDSKLLAVCGVAGEAGFGKYQADYAVQLWEVSAGKEVPGFIRHGAAGHVAFSPDGKFIASAPWNSLFFPPGPMFILNPHNLLHLWDRSAGEAVKLSSSYHGFLWGIAFSPDSSQLAVAAGKHISLLDIGEGEEVHRFECGSKCAAPTFSPDGKFLAVHAWHGFVFATPDDHIEAWDVSSGRRQAFEPELTSWGCSIAFVPASQVLATTQVDNTIPFWDIASGRELRRIEFPNGAPCTFVFTPDGKELIGGGPESNPVVHMWDAKTGRDLQQWDLTSILESGEATKKK